ncbi:MAG: rhomboid family intramembrane serine protease, partial [Nonlabens sp.]|nr:rhomboid family intramembrane serine protease [Nonlabens sp.]
MDIATIVIIAINALVSFKGFEDRYFFDKYKFNIAGIQRGEQARFVTSGFLHADLQHLAFNMIT